MSSKTLGMILEHFDKPFSNKETIIELPFDLESFCRENDQIIHGLQKALAKQIADIRVCPRCGHAFVPLDKTSDHAIDTLSGIRDE